MRRTLGLPLAALLAVVCAPGARAGQPATAPQLVTFNVPQAGCTAIFPYCTTPFAINASGAITGVYFDANGDAHGFVRAPNGAITAFDASDAPCNSGICTAPQTITDAGVIAGDYDDARGEHGFVRAADGAITSIDVPGGAASSVADMNPSGVIVGQYFDASGLGWTGYIRSVDGRFTALHVSRAHVEPTRINAVGEVTGTVLDLSGRRAFIRSVDGTLKVFSGPDGRVATPTGINDSGVITGEENLPDGVGHGFTLQPDGTFNLFDAPKQKWTSPSAINQAGAIVGWESMHFIAHGFLRRPDGSFVRLGRYLLPEAINDAGSITGTYIDSNGFETGFVLTGEQ